MAQTIISSAMLTSIRQHILSLAAYGQYMIGGTWYRGEIVSSGIQASGAVRVAFSVEPQDAVLTPATQFRLCAADGTILSSKAENLPFVQGASDALLYRFQFGVKVGENE